MFIYKDVIKYKAYVNNLKSKLPLTEYYISNKPQLKLVTIQTQLHTIPNKYTTKKCNKKLAQTIK